MNNYSSNMVGSSSSSNNIKTEVVRSSNDFKGNLVNSSKNVNCNLVNSSNDLLVIAIMLAAIMLVVNWWV